MIVEHVPAPLEEAADNDTYRADTHATCRNRTSVAYDADGLASTHGVSGSIGRFALGRIIGKGGQAIVYAAREKSSNVPLAIKVIDKSRVCDLRVMQRICLEIEIGRALQHANICGVQEALVSSSHVRVIFSAAGCPTLRPST